MPLLHFAKFCYTDWKGERQQKFTLFSAPGFRELEIFTRLKKLVNDGTILSYLTELERSVAEAFERQVGKMLENDTEYLRAVAVGDLAKARGLENMERILPGSRCMRRWCMCETYSLLYNIL